jgi:uncharacterized protein YhjY with autotransporter beta-barrel domain
MRAKASFFWTNNNGVNNNPEIVVGSTTVGTGTNIDGVTTAQATVSINLGSGNSVLATGYNAIANTNGSSTSTITIGGNISTSGDGIDLAGNGSITNSGLIATTGGFGIAVNGNATLNNTGTITNSGGSAFEAVRIYGTSTITNMGTISGTVYGVGIGANSTLFNYGTISGPADSVYYNSPNGTVVIETNSVFNGTINGAGATNAKLDFNINGLTSQQQTALTTYLNTHAASGTYTIGADTYTWAGFATGDVALGTGVVTIMSSTFATTPGLDSNQRGIASNIDTASVGSSSAISHITTALGSLPVSNIAGALDELAPTKFNQFASSTAFNNATFAVADMDNYLDGERTGPNGTFAGGNGQVDTRNFVIQDANVDPGLQMIHSRMLAWNDLPGTITDVPGAVLGGIDMKDAKQMKSCPACTASSPWNVFLRGSVVLAQDFSQADVPHSDNNTVSITAGADYRLSEHFLVGATMSYAHTDATLDDFGSSGTVDSYSPGIYASYADGGWFANFIGRYSYNSYTENRNIAFLGQTANGGTEGNEGMIDLDGGYLFHSGPWSYGPVAGIQYTHLTVDGYTEQDSDANLTVQEDQSDSLRSRLGGEVRYNTCGCGVTFSPHLTATWQHEFLDQSRGLTSSFTQFSGGSFTVRTDDPSRDSALVDLGLDAKVASSVTVFGDYVVQAGQSNYFGQSLQAGVRVNF